MICGNILLVFMGIKTPTPPLSLWSLLRNYAEAYSSSCLRSIQLLPQSLINQLFNVYEAN